MLNWNTSHQFSFPTGILLEAANTSLQTTTGEYTQTMRPTVAPSCQPASRWVLPGLNLGPDSGPSSTVTQQHYSEENLMHTFRKTLLQQLMHKVRGKKSQKWASELLWHWHQQHEPLKHPQMMLQGLFLTVRAWLNSPTPQQANAILKEQAGSLPHFLPASQLCFSQKQEHMKMKPSVCQELFFSDHSHLTYTFEKAFLSDHSFQT